MSAATRVIQIFSLLQFLHVVGGWGEPFKDAGTGEAAMKMALAYDSSLSGVSDYCGVVGKGPLDCANSFFSGNGLMSYAGRQAGINCMSKMQTSHEQMQSLLNALHSDPADMALFAQGMQAPVFEDIGGKRQKRDASPEDINKAMLRAKRAGREYGKSVYGVLAGSLGIYIGILGAVGPAKFKFLLPASLGAIGRYMPEEEGFVHGWEDVYQIAAARNPYLFLKDNELSGNCVEGERTCKDKHGKEYFNPDVNESPDDDNNNDPHAGSGSPGNPGSTGPGPGSPGPDHEPDDDIDHNPPPTSHDSDDSNESDDHGEPDDHGKTGTPENGPDLSGDGTVTVTITITTPTQPPEVDNSQEMDPNTDPNQFLRKCVRQEEQKIIRVMGAQHKSQDIPLTEAEKLERAGQQLLWDLCDRQVLGQDYCRKWEQDHHTEALDPELREVTRKVFGQMWACPGRRLTQDNLLDLSPCEKALQDARSRFAMDDTWNIAALNAFAPGKKTLKIPMPLSFGDDIAIPQGVMPPEHNGEFFTPVCILASTESRPDMPKITFPPIDIPDDFHMFTPEFTLSRSSTQTVLYLPGGHIGTYTFAPTRVTFARARRTPTRTLGIHDEL